MVIIFLHRLAYQSFQHRVLFYVFKKAPRLFICHSANGKHEKLGKVLEIGSGTISEGCSTESWPVVQETAKHIQMKGCNREHLNVDMLTSKTKVRLQQRAFKWLQLSKDHSSQQHVFRHKGGRDGHLIDSLVGTWFKQPSFWAAESLYSCGYMLLVHHLPQTITMYYYY